MSPTCSLNTLLRLRRKMLLATPYQMTDISNISLASYYKDKKERIISPIYYTKNGLTLQGLTILCPPLTVSSYDASMNRLQLNVANYKGFTNKFIAIQDFLGQTNATIALQKLCTPTILTLYLFPSTQVQKSIGTITMADVKPGDTLRCVIRLHNLVLIEIKGQQILRLQHSIPIVYQTNE